MSEGFWLTLISNYGLAISASGAAVSGAYVIYKRIILPMFRSVGKYNDLCEKVDKIFFEITPNGGNSIKDTVNKVSKDLSKLYARQDALLADVDEAIFEADSEGNWVWVNRTCARTTQRMPSELMGHGWHNTIPEDIREHVVNSWDSAVRERRELSLSLKFETPDGSLKKAKLRSYRMTDSDGGIIGFLGTVTFL